MNVLPWLALSVGIGHSASTEEVLQSCDMQMICNGTSQIAGNDDSARSDTKCDRGNWNSTVVIDKWSKMHSYTGAISVCVYEINDENFPTFLNHQINRLNSEEKYRARVPELTVNYTLTTDPWQKPFERYYQRLGLLHATVDTLLKNQTRIFGCNQCWVIPRDLVPMIPMVPMELDGVARGARGNF